MYILVLLLMLCFNPRICKRCDATRARHIRNEYVSIHASVKDATPLTLIVGSWHGVSIHASVKDATTSAPG